MEIKKAILMDEKDNVATLLIEVEEGHHVRIEAGEDGAAWRRCARLGEAGAAAAQVRALVAAGSAPRKR